MLANNTTFPGAAAAASFKQPSCCPLCHNRQTDHFHTDSRREYRHCQVCDLVFVPPQFHLQPAEEKQRYDLHENDPADPAYRRFLLPAAEAIRAALSPSACGLDYGCGPGPALAQMLRESGFQVALYDPLYFPESHVLQQQYDFITCTETFEHFNNPAQDWKRICDCLKPGGILVVMTQMRLAERDFGVWRYKDDDTHVAFWSAAGFDYLASRDAMQVEHLRHSLVRLTKPA